MRARFHLPGLTKNFSFNLIFAHMMKNCPYFFRDGAEIASFYGIFPPAVWNGGRSVRGRCDESYVKQVITTFNNMGIPVRFTFTNPCITEELLHDPFCNRILELAYNDLNEVIVNSALLEDYIRDKYPNFKLTSSTCKRLDTVDGPIGELKKDYSIVVLDYDLNNQFDQLEKIPVEDRGRCEILCNTLCNPKCKMRKEHYRLIGEHSIAYNDYVNSGSTEPFDLNKYYEINEENVINCGCFTRNAFDIRKLPTHVSPDDIWEKYIPMGFEQFKLEGRTAGRIFLTENYLYYMVKPECRDEARLMLLYNLERNGIIRVDK